MTRSRSSARATRADVARKAGVSPTAVTMVLSDRYSHVSISQPTRDRIIAAAKALNYKPNLQARGLKSRRSMLMAFLCHQSYCQAQPIMLGMQKALNSTDYAILHCLRDRTLEGEARQLRSCWDRCVDGIVLSPLITADGQTNVRQIFDMVERGMSLVQMPTHVLSEVPSVTIDYQAAVQIVIDHLMEQGHKRIAIITSPTGWDSGKPETPSDRIRHYQKYMAQQGLEPIVLPLIQNLESWSNVDRLIDHEMSLAQMVLDHPARPTAVMATHDRIGIALTRALVRMGKPAPESVSVTGMHNEPIAQMSLPRLTTLEMHHDRMGSVAAQMVLQQIEGESVESCHMRPSLVVRESTGPPTR